jgi:hypothetical protein
MRNETARAINALCGAWLLLSAFLWTHSEAQFRNAIVVGVMAIIAAVSAAAKPPLRYLNSILGVWLLVSVWTLPRMSMATLWNDVLIGAALITFSLVGPIPAKAGMTSRSLQ